MRGRVRPLKLELLAKSSSGESQYLVQFLLEDGRLSVFCNCSAGEFGKLCRHKLSFLAGEGGMLALGDQSAALAEIQGWVDQSDFRALLRELAMAEARLEAAHADVSAAKKSIERLMKQGAKLVRSDSGTGT